MKFLHSNRYDTNLIPQASGVWESIAYQYIDFVTRIWWMIKKQKVKYLDT